MPPPSSLRIRVGVDVVGVERVTRLVTENAAILGTILTDREREYCVGKRRCYEHVAGRFAAKEAVLKAFGTGVGERMSWTDVEIVNGRGGRPEVRLHGEVATWAERRGLADVEVSLAHSRGLALAQAIAIWREGDGARENGEQARALPPD